MKVTPYVINRGSSSEYWGLKSVEEDPRDSQVMRTPKWKSKQAAIKWAKKNGYDVVESSTRSSRRFVVSATNVSCSDLTDDEAQTLYVLSEFASDVIRDIEKDYGKKLSPDGWGKVMDYTESITRDPNMYRMTGNDIESAKLHLESVICDIYEDDTGITGIYESEDIKCSSRRKYTQAKATVPEESAADFKKFLDSIGVDYTTEDVPNGVEFMYGIYVGSKESNRIDKYLNKITSDIRGGKELNKRKFVIKASRDSSFKTFDVTTSATNEVMKGWDGKSFVDIARQCSTIEPHSAKGTIITVADRKGNTRSYEVIRKGAVRDVTGDTHEERQAMGASVSAKRRFTVTAASSAAEKDLYDDLYSYADQYRMTSRWTKEIVTKYLDRQKSFRKMSDSDFQKVVDRVNRDFKRKKKVKSDPYSDMSYKSGVESSESTKRRFTVTGSASHGYYDVKRYDGDIPVEIKSIEDGVIYRIVKKGDLYRVAALYDGNMDYSNEMFDSPEDASAAMVNYRLTFRNLDAYDHESGKFYFTDSTKIGKRRFTVTASKKAVKAYAKSDMAVNAATDVKCSEEEEGFHLYGYDADGADVTTGYSDSEMGLEDEIGNLFADESVDTVDIYENGISGYGDYIGAITRSEYDSDSTGRLLELLGMKDAAVESSEDIKCAYRDNTIDKEAVRELVLYITNDGDLYRQRVTPMIENLKRKVKKGVYDREKAVKLWQYLADEGVKKYGKEFGPGASVAWLNPATREEIARELRDYYEEEVMWEDSPVEASTYMIVPDSGATPFDSEVIDILAYYGYNTIEDFALANGISDFVKAKQILLEKYAEDTGSGYPSSLWDGKSENEIYADLPEAGFIDDDTPYL